MSLKTTVFEYAKLSSAHFIFLTAIIPLTGAIAMGEKDLFLLTILFLIGLTAHIFGFGLNHYVDIEVDRLIYSTNKRPLPRGIISKKHAILYILLVLFLGCILTVYFYGVQLLLLYLFGILLASIYDLYSKKISGMDFVLAASVMVGVVFGAATVSFQFSPLMYILCILAFLQTLNLNLIAGGIKDADHDYLIGSKHLSTRLGVRVKQEVLCIPASFQFIAYLLGVLYAFCVFLPILFQVILLHISLILILILFNILFFIVTYKMVHLKFFNRQEVRKYVVLQYTINWLNIPILLMSVAPLAGFLLLYPIIGLIVSNMILYRTIVRPQVM
ncbi:MAG TPA: UbiA family prenyltransferase [Candidatus Thermoplasmatota archaeon]|nr:UbiA family prenyltransferase [Candidatus Thermoplasmatota archaeon]